MRGFLGTFCTWRIDCHRLLIMSINLPKQLIDKPIKHQFFDYEALRLAGRVPCLIDTLVLNRACLTSPLTTWLVKEDTVHRNTMQSEVCPAHLFWPGRSWSWRWRQVSSSARMKEIYSPMTLTKSGIQTSWRKDFAWTAVNWSKCYKVSSGSATRSSDFSYSRYILLS